MKKAANARSKRPAQSIAASWNCRWLTFDRQTGRLLQQLHKARVREAGQQHVPIAVVTAAA